MGSAVICTTCGAMWPEYCRCIATVSNTSPSPYFAELLSLRAEVERLRTELREHCELAKSSNQEHADIEAAWRAEVERLREERRWIPVEERLPATGRHLATDGYRVWTAFWLDCRWTDPMSSGDPQPTHWQPLPAPPEKEEE